MIVNVAVAWGCALWLPLIPNKTSASKLALPPDDVPFWVIYESQRQGARRFLFMRVPVVFKNAPGELFVFDDIEPREFEQFNLGNIPKWSRFDLTNTPPALHQTVVEYDCAFEDARGWPLSALYASGQFYHPEILPHAEPRIASGIWIDNYKPTTNFYPIFDDWYVKRFLPLLPIWPGFAINTIFYAAFLWILALGPFTAHRVIRRKRGLCIKCGYDLRGNSERGCPECGWGRDQVKA